MKKTIISLNTDILTKVNVGWRREDGWRGLEEGCDCQFYFLFLVAPLPKIPYWRGIVKNVEPVVC